MGSSPHDQINTLFRPQRTCKATPETMHFIVGSLFPTNCWSPDQSLSAISVTDCQRGDIDLRFGFDIQFRVGIPFADESPFSHDKALFEVLASSFGLEPSDHDRTLRTGGEAFRITAINPNRPKYPISAERLVDARGYNRGREGRCLSESLRRMIRADHGPYIRARVYQA